ncbi:MAG: hypothetical protein IPK64_20050 [bacterium]|nr:hypothetical protein [bacterium]
MNETTTAIADRIGELDAIIKPLAKEREALAAGLKARGAGRYAGDLWSCTVVEAERTTTDWRAVAERLGPSRQLITAHTTTTPVVTLRVTGV